MPRQTAPASHQAGVTHQWLRDRSIIGTAAYFFRSIMATDFSQHSWLVISSTAIMVAYFAQHSWLFIAATALMAAYVFHSPHGCLFSQHSGLLTHGCLFLPQHFLTALIMPTCRIVS
jgi:hypothetical protein